jgi:hypothetical protein
LYSNDKAEVGRHIAKHILTVLTPALIELMRAVELNHRQTLTRPNVLRPSCFGYSDLLIQFIQTRRLQPIDWLAQFMFRNNPKYGTQCSAALDYGSVVSSVLAQEEERVMGVQV